MVNDTHDADGVTLMPDDRGWSHPGGHEEDDSITLYIGTASGQYEVTLPISIDDTGALVVGAPVVSKVER